MLCRFASQNLILIQKNFKRLLTLALKFKIVLWGSYAHWTLRERKQFAEWMKVHHCEQNWMITGPISVQLSKNILKECSALVLAGQKFTPIEITEYYLRAIQAEAVIIGDSRQASVHADLWKHSINCWILDKEHLEKDLNDLLERSSFEVPEILSDLKTQNEHLVDSSLNELNRLYNKALSHLR